MSVLTSSTILFLLSVGLLNVVRAQRSASRETGQQGPGASGGFMPPGQAKKMGSGEFMPPGQAKKMQGMGGSGEAQPNRNQAQNTQQQSSQQSQITNINFGAGGGTPPQGAMNDQNAANAQASSMNAGSLSNQ